MSKWGVLKQARQRMTRMEAKGIITNASETFKQSLAAIDAKNISRAEKTRLKEQAAETYMESGYSTTAQIWETFNSVADTYLKERKAAGDTKSVAAFLGAADNERAVILARHYLGSGTPQQAGDPDAVGDDPKAFYQIMVTAVAQHATEPDPDAIQGLIDQMIDAAKG